jgi:ribosome-associated protein
MKQTIDLFITEASEKKAENILFVDTQAKNHPIADSILVVSALNEIHIKAILDALLRFYKKNKGDQLKDLDFFGVSGKPDSKWVILDFNTLLIHIMEKELRTQYDFDKLFDGHEVYRYY